MAMKLHFLGTSCMVPTKDRNHLSVALEYDGSIFLFDCGEATQHQIKKMKLPIGKIKKIFISHWHGDHTIGLIGLIQTLSNTENVQEIEIHGPINSKKFISHMLKSTIFEPKIDIKVFEHMPKEGELLEIINNSKYKIITSKLNHSVPCIGYSLIEKDVLNIDKEKAKEYDLENNPILARAKLGLDININGKKIKAEEITYKKKGKKISFVFDTRPCQGIDILVKNSDYLVMEATFIYRTHFHKAEEFDHMSARETAEIAATNNVSKLIITHFSQRYKDVKEIEEEAKEYFENTIVSYDFMTLNLK